MNNLGLWDPQEPTKEQPSLLDLGEQGDWPWSEGIDSLSHDQVSYLRLRIRNTLLIEGMFSFTKEKVTELISDARNFQMAGASEKME